MIIDRVSVGLPVVFRDGGGVDRQAIVIGINADNTVSLFNYTTAAIVLNVVVGGIAATPTNNTARIALGTELDKRPKAASV